MTRRHAWTRASRRPEPQARVRNPPSACIGALRRLTPGVDKPAWATEGVTLCAPAGHLHVAVQPQAGPAALQASVSSGGGAFLNTVLYDSNTFDCVTASDGTPTQAGVSLPRSAFSIAIASATP